MTQIISTKNIPGIAVRDTDAKVRKPAMMSQVEHEQTEISDLIMRNMRYKAEDQLIDLKGRLQA